MNHYKTYRHASVGAQHAAPHARTTSSAPRDPCYVADLPVQSMEFSMKFNDAYKLMGRDESFRATVYAMNTLLIKKGIYTSKEFEQLFCEHAINFQRDFSARPSPADS
jgi:hypothetical protein